MCSHECGFTQRNSLTTPSIVTGLFAALFWPNLRRLWLKTNPISGEPNWQHSFFVPLIGLYYLYLNRDGLLKARVDTAWTGLPILLGGLLMFAYGIWPGQNDFVKDFGMVVTLFGVVLLTCGWRVMQTAWFPIAFLVCAIPWPGLFYSEIAWPLQQLAAKVVHETDDTFAFEDLNPQAPCHVLVIPKEHIPTVDDISPAQQELIGKLFTTAQEVVKKKGCQEEGYRLVMNCGEAAGQSLDMTVRTSTVAAANRLARRQDELGLERAEPFAEFKGRTIGFVGRSEQGVPFAELRRRCTAA